MPQTNHTDRDDKIRACAEDIAKKFGMYDLNHFKTATEKAISLILTILHSHNAFPDESEDKRSVIHFLENFKLYVPQFAQLFDSFRNEDTDWSDHDKTLRQKMTEFMVQCEVLLAKHQAIKSAISQEGEGGVRVNPSFKHYKDCPTIDSKPVCTCGTQRFS